VPTSWSTSMPLRTVTVDMVTPPQYVNVNAPPRVNS
jgi:hypothetical protein